MSLSTENGGMGGGGGIEDKVGLVGRLVWECICSLSTITYACTSNTKPTLCYKAILNWSYDNMIRGLCDSKPVHQQIQNLTIFSSRNPSYQ